LLVARLPFFPLSTPFQKGTFFFSKLNPKTLQSFFFVPGSSMKKNNHPTQKLPQEKKKNKTKKTKIDASSLVNQVS